MEILHSTTGSKGNFSCITDGKTMIAIDCGIPLDKANKAIGYKLSKASAILVTHSHQDHTKYVKDFLNRCIPCYMSPQCKETLELDNYYTKKIEPLKTIVVGSMAIVPFELPHTNHDGTPCQNYGYLIYSAVTKERMLWCTDCHYIPHNFPPCEYYCIECNYYDVQDYSKLDDVNVSVERRRFRSHLSLANCIRFLKSQDLSKAKQIRLLHISSSTGNIANYLRAKVQEEFLNIQVSI